MTNSVLITGGSGLIGRRLTEMLLQKGCRVSHLGRSVRTGKIPAFRWDPQSRSFDDRALEGVDTIVHLAGTGIAENRWTQSRKKEILDSRVRSTAFLAEVLARNKHSVRTLVAASAIGYYGLDVQDKSLTETDAPGTDFLASVVVRWEEEGRRFLTLGIRLVQVRVGIVLSTDGGALKELARPVWWGVGAPLGNGHQVMSWIHIDDLCELFAWSISNEGAKGVYNGVAPSPVSNYELTCALAARMNRRIWLPPVPGFVLRMLLGEMAALVIYGSRVSCEKALSEGFAFKYSTLETALNALYPGVRQTARQ